MTCIECMMAETSPALVKAAWDLSSASSLEEAQRMDTGRPSYWAGRIMEQFHEAGHDIAKAVVRLGGS